MTPAEYIQRLQDDYLFFLDELWIDRGLDKKAPLGRLERDIAHYFAYGPPQRGILSWRGVGKTTFGTAAYAAWRLFRDPDIKILIVSKSLGEAKKTIRLMRRWLTEVWFLSHLDPALTPGAADNATEFEVTGSVSDRSPSVTAVGIDGQLPSKRAHIVIGDDVETQDNVKTFESRLELDEKVKEFKAIASFGDREIVFVGTYHHETESIYAKLAARRMPDGSPLYTFRTWPIRYLSPGQKCLNLAPMLQEDLDAGRAAPGQPTCPDRFGDMVIASYEAEGRTFFAMQFLLLSDIGESNHFPLRLSDLMVMDIDRDTAPVAVVYGQRDHNGSTVITEIPSLGFGDDRFYRPLTFEPTRGKYTGTKMAIDPAGRGADKTGVAVISHLNGTLWLKRLEGHEGGSSPEALDRLAMVARDTRAREVYIEDNFGRGMFAQLFAPILARFAIPPGTDPMCPEGWAATIVDDTKITNATGQKEIRIIDALEPVCSTHRLVIDRSVALNQSFQHQYTRITRQKGALAHEDELDALSLCVRAWQYALRMDPEKNKQRSIDRALEQEVDQQAQALERLTGAKPRDGYFIKHRRPTGA
jgi:hypothetical protein